MGWGRTFRHSCSVGDVLCQVRGQGVTGPRDVEPGEGFWGAVPAGPLKTEGFQAVGVSVVGTERRGLEGPVCFWDSEGQAGQAGASYFFRPVSNE